MAGRSIVEYFAEHEKYRCGYCGSKDTNYSHGMWAHSLTVEDYQDLIDRGWRRSGKYVYKPTMDQTCCPQYTIKCEALKFVPSRSQKKVLKRVNKYLNTGVKSGGSQEGDAESNDAPMGPEMDMSNRGAKVLGDIGKDIKGAVTPSCSSVSDSSRVINQKSSDTGKGPKLCDTGQSPNVDNKGDAHESLDARAKEGRLHPPKKEPRPGEGADPTKPKCRKAKEIRLEKKRLKAAKMQVDSDACDKNNKSDGKSLEDFLGEVVANPAHRLEVRLVRSSPRSAEFKATFDQSYSVYKKYQMVIHKDPPDKPTVKQYTRFLVDSPLEEEHTPGGLAEGLGSFHQQYWLDGHLVAVGVIDILPRCTSSVYLYYDPDYSFLSPGTYSALREIDFTKQLHRKQSSIEYYYMGFYIHSCPKMVYKGKYYPSYLLCPETYGWYSIEDCRTKLDAAKYSRFAPADKVDENKMTNLGEVLILHQRQLMPYGVYRMLNSDVEDEEEVKQYAGFVGRQCARRMLLFRS